MLIPTPTIYKKRRGRIKDEAAVPAPPAALEVTYAEVVILDGSEATIQIVFNTTEDHPLADVSGADATKWTAEIHDGVFVGVSIANHTYDSLLLQVTSTGEEDPGPDALNYSNAPSDVADEDGRMLAAFVGFAMVSPP